MGVFITNYVVFARINNIIIYSVSNFNIHAEIIACTAFKYRKRPKFKKQFKDTRTAALPHI